MGYTNASAILSCGVIIANLGVKFDLSVGMFEAAERAKSQTFVGFSTICIEVTEQYGKPIVFVSIPINMLKLFVWDVANQRDVNLTRFAMPMIRKAPLTCHAFRQRIVPKHELDPAVIGTDQSAPKPC
jgi:hypothetical protein